ncbi:ATP-binding protein [Streptomyces sp. NBC_00820]|uniref:ATP-binding protein n=1 Tax=Streptomyces sp. NBC_00820 TaxID=2975842 RepID=UPI002ED0A797|nr:ATP-binding protein [Streptomyces sp. NBC_00820]
MNPLMQDVLLWAPSVAAAAAGSVAIRYRVKASRSARAAAEADRRAAVLEAEAAHLAATRLPRHLLAQESRADAATPSEGPLHAELGGTATDTAYLSVLEQMSRLIAEQTERSEGAARVAVRAATRSVQSLGYELQVAITQLLDTRHDDRLLELIQPIDHATSQLLRRLQLLSVLTGSWPGRRRDDTALLDAVRGGMSRIRDFRRVQVPATCEFHVSGRIVEALVLVLAELMDNAARQSAPTTPVEVTILEAHRGVSIQIHDAGPGMAVEVRHKADRRLSGREPFRFTEIDNPAAFGHAGVGDLASRYGFHVSIDEEYSRHGGTRAVVFVPRDLLVDAPATPAPEPATRSTPAPAGTDAGNAAEPARSYPVAEDGLPMRRRVAPQRAESTLPTTEPPPRDAGQALAAFARITRAHAPAQPSAPKEPTS